MSWFNPSPKKHPQKMMVAQPHFLGEQDGTPEHELKERLVAFFHRDQSVQTAYLARVRYGEQGAVNVALCLRTQFGPDGGLAEKVGRIFATMFGSHEHLDTRRVLARSKWILHFVQNDKPGDISATVSVKPL
jgi:hypothetical protein